MITDKSSTYKKAINILMQLDRKAAKVEGLISDITSELYKRLLTK